MKGSNKIEMIEYHSSFHAFGYSDAKRHNVSLVVNGRDASLNILQPPSVTKITGLISHSLVNWINVLILFVGIDSRFSPLR